MYVGVKEFCVTVMGKPESRLVPPKAWVRSTTSVESMTPISGNLPLPRYIAELLLKWSKTFAYSLFTANVLFRPNLCYGTVKGTSLHREAVC